ncbi:phage tail tape measure protein [Anaerobacillus sp. HL2]|nr:phage tail tape measure protein [Anaerobacillus sp. HL2]
MTVLESIKGLDKEKQTAIMSQIFGTESLSAIAPLLQNLDMLQENFDKMGDATKYAGSMQEEFDARSSTTENKLIC